MIGGEDILYMMSTLRFENYTETLKTHLAKLRQVRSDSCFSNLKEMLIGVYRFLRISEWGFGSCDGSEG